MIFTINPWSKIKLLMNVLWANFCSMNLSISSIKYIRCSNHYYYLMIGDQSWVQHWLWNYLFDILLNWTNVGSIGSEFWDPFGLWPIKQSFKDWRPTEYNFKLKIKFITTDSFVYWPISLLFYSQISRRCTLLDRQVDIIIIIHWQ